MIAIYLTILLSLAASGIDGGWLTAKRNLQGCQTCFHMTYEIYNMPEFYKIITRSALSGWNLVNTDCWAGTSAIQVCAAPQYPDMLVDRCHSAVITITAEGLQILPKAKIVVNMVVRGCGRVKQRTVNQCGGLEMLDAEDQENIRNMLGEAEGLWHSIDISGDICIENLHSLYY